VTTVNIRDPKVLPAAVWEPKLVRLHSGDARVLANANANANASRLGRANPPAALAHQITAGRKALSAALLVSSTPSTSTNNHKAGSTFKSCRQVRTVLAKGVFSLEPTSYFAASSKWDLSELRMDCTSSWNSQRAYCSVSNLIPKFK